MGFLSGNKRKFLSVFREGEFILLKQSNLLRFSLVSNETICYYDATKILAPTIEQQNKSCGQFNLRNLCAVSILDPLWRAFFVHQGLKSSMQILQFLRLQQSINFQQFSDFTKTTN